MNDVLRTDLLGHGMNAGKERKVFDLLRAWRTCAVRVGREQWRLFFETGSLNKNHRSTNESDLAQIVGAANRLQMVRYQVAGILDSYLSNRQNEFSQIIECSSLPAETRHQLHFVNRWKAWFGREPLVMKDGAEIPQATRRLARQVMRAVLARHRRPDLSGINMVIDQRAAKLRCEEIGLDSGLRTLFATDQGDLLGQSFLRQLRAYDQRISRLAAYRQSRGLRTRSPRYDRYVRQMRGFLRTEINRVLNRVVRVQRPGRIVVEKLDFRNPELSRRMNRLVSNAGRRIIQQKRTDLRQSAP